MKLSVIIPVFNEEKTIEKVLRSVYIQDNVYEIVAVNDGSTDKTLQILNRLKIKMKNLKVINHKNNLGKGSALKTGFNHTEGDYIIIQDADLEYSPEEFSKLTSLAYGRNAVYGSRMLGKNPHAYLSTYLGNVLLTSLCNLLFSTKLTDIYTCYKLIPTKTLKSLKLNGKGFEIEAEITARLLKNDVTLSEVPINYNPRTYEKGKKIKAVDALKGIITLIKIRFS